MNDKVYVLLDIVDGKAEQVVQVLQEIPGVVMVDALEGPPDVIILMEAAKRQHLAKLTVQALTLVELMTEHVCLLPTRERLNNWVLPKISSQNRRGGKREGSKAHC